MPGPGAAGSWHAWFPRISPGAIFIGSLRQASAVGFRDVRRKVSVSLRLDPEMLAWLRGIGPGI